jgi:hypothetical protein
LHGKSRYFQPAEFRPSKDGAYGDLSIRQAHEAACADAARTGGVGLPIGRERMTRPLVIDGLRMAWFRGRRANGLIFTFGSR